MAPELRKHQLRSGSYWRLITTRVDEASQRGTLVCMKCEGQPYCTVRLEICSYT